MLCNVCGDWSPNDEDTTNLANVTLERTTTLDQVEAASIERVVTGGPWDAVWGGGFVPGSLTLVGGSAGMGKALCLETPLPTPDGWVTMGEVAAGARLLDENGDRCRVRRVFDVLEGRPCFKVDFSDGEHIIADAEHLWLTRDGWERDNDTDGSIRTTAQLASSTFKIGHVWNHSIDDYVRGHQRRYVTSVVAVESVPVRCIAVDSPSRLYLAGPGLIPTHNTTMTIQIASLFALQSGKSAYFLSAEQAPGEIRMTAERLQIPNLAQFRVMKAFGGGADIDKALLKKDPPSCFIWDSVSTLCGRDTHAAVVVSRNAKRLAVEHKCPALLISHMNKAGDFGGLYTLQHDVDVIISVFPLQSERDEAKLRADGHTDATITDVREITAWKNRFGPSNKDFHMMMTAHGIMPLPAVPEKGKRGARRKATVPMSDIDLHEAAPPPRKDSFKRPVVDAILMPDGQKLVRAARAQREKIKSKAHMAGELLKGLGDHSKPLKATVEEITLSKGRAAAVEGEALKTRRAPMPKAKGAWPKVTGTKGIGTKAAKSGRIKAVRTKPVTAQGALKASKASKGKEVRV